MSIRSHWQTLSALLASRRDARAFSSSPTATSLPIRLTTRFLRFQKMPSPALSPRQFARRAAYPKTPASFSRSFRRLERAAQRRPAFAVFRRISSGLLRSRRSERRKHLARHPRIFFTSGTARPDGNTQATGQRRHLSLLRRARLYLFPQRRDQRRLFNALQGQANLDHARRLCFHVG